ncbi:hypothetical protein JKP88DRAFT_288838 [Tribonema minus]|uniref:Uncharacterized protein n=1 Tax=Tribonema minus TaxID=303371 RepID=A0A835Z9F4_9STRA|nr:hypothetical protein JKP88DRAFT_288838 [Tribonema minus]
MAEAASASPAAGAGLDVHQILADAEDRGISIPRGKKECKEVVDSVIKVVQEYSDDKKHMWGLTAKAGKKRKAEIDKRVPGPVGKKPVVDQEVMEWPVDDKGTSMRELSERLCLEAKKRGIALPEADEKAGDAPTIALCTDVLEQCKTERSTVDVIRALALLQEKTGVAEEPRVKNLVGDEKTGVAEEPRVKNLVQENTALVEALRELANSYFKAGAKDSKNRIRGAMLQRGATAIRDLDWAITPENMPVASGKSDKKVPNVGHDTIEYIKEFFETGKITKLEEAKIEE